MTLLWFGTFLQWLLDVVIPPPQRVLQKSLGFLDSRIVQMILSLNVPDAIGNGALRVDDLAQMIGMLTLAIGSTNSRHYLSSY